MGEVKEIKPTGNLIYYPIYYEFQGMNWWTDHYFKYPYVLISAGQHHMEKNMREKRKFGKDVNVMSDSGGYQIASGFLEHINFLDVLRWQEANSDMGLIIDIPPVKFYSDSKYSTFGDMKHFKKTLERTKVNAEMAMKYRQRKEFKLFGVVQGYDYKTINMWFDRINEVGEFDGWALSPKWTNIGLISAFYGCWVLDKGIKEPIHYLGISGLKQIIPILTYISKYIKQNISFDSGFITSGNMFRKYMNPFGLMYIRLLTKDSVRKDGMIDKDFKTTCPCPVCRNGVEFYTDNSLGSMKMNLHNLYWMINYINFIQSIKHRDDDIMRLVKLFGINPIPFEMVDFYLDKRDLELTYEKYKDLFFKQKKRYKQSSLERW
ncbi:MAG: hypothetical protein ACE5KE_04225 [Methanosarcinales archaeon]